MIDAQSMLFTGVSFVVCMVLATVTIVRRGGEHTARIILFYAFIVYVCGVVSVTLLPIQTHLPDRDVVINLIPFNTIAGYFTEYTDAGSLGAELFTWNVLGNVIIFVPFGFFIGMLYKRCQNIVFALALSVAFSACIEVLQALEMLMDTAFSRITDIDDVILNTAGAMLGYAVYRLGFKRRNSKNLTAQNAS